MIRIVLDTNTLVSAHISKCGPPASIFQAWKNGNFELFTSPFQLKELERVLNYPRIKKRYRLISADIEKIVGVISRQAQVVYPANIPTVIKEDDADNQILAIALEAKAEFLVSGDLHLLRQKKFKGTQIIPAKEFVENL